MGQIKKRANQLKEAERIKQKEREIWITEQFNEEREVVRRAFENKYPDLIELLPTDGIQWKVMPEDYDASGRKEYHSPKFKIMFYVDGDDFPATINSPFQCRMDIMPAQPGHTDLKTRWENPKIRCRPQESPGSWDNNHIILWLDDNLLEPAGHERSQEAAARDLTFSIHDYQEGKQLGEDFDFLSDLAEWAWEEILVRNATFYTVHQTEPGAATKRASLEDVLEIYDKKGSVPETLEHLKYE